MQLHDTIQYRRERSGLDVPDDPLCDLLRFSTQTVNVTATSRALRNEMERSCSLSEHVHADVVIEEAAAPPRRDEAPILQPCHELEVHFTALDLRRRETRSNVGKWIRQGIQDVSHLLVIEHLVKQVEQ